MRISADRRSAITFDAFFESPFQRDAKVSDNGRDLFLSGRAGVGFYSKGDIRYASHLRALSDGGRVFAENGVMSVVCADSVTLIFSAATSFVNWQDGSSGDEKSRSEAYLEGALNYEYAALRERHVASYRSQFDTCRLEMPDPHPGLTIPERLERNRTEPDTYLAALYFAFGRYLLISSSQPGTQPITLQGIWNEWLAPPWMSRYTININLQMNY
jgi:alpha-L-fucosidase 2